MDNKPGTASTVADTNFGLGKTPANQNIGYYNLRLMDSGITVDSSSAPRGVIGSVNNGFSWADHDNSHLTEDVTYAAGDIGYLPIAGLVHVFAINVETRIAKTDDLTINADIPLDGSATITVHYL